MWTLSTASWSPTSEKHYDKQMEHVHPFAQDLTRGVYFKRRAIKLSPFKVRRRTGLKNKKKIIEAQRFCSKHTSYCRILRKVYIHGSYIYMFPSICSSRNLAINNS